MYNHYKKDVTRLESIDVYRILELYNVTDPCVQHAVKKLLCAGNRGSKTEEQDIIEARDTLNRKLEINEEDTKQNLRFMII